MPVFRCCFTNGSRVVGAGIDTGRTVRLAVFLSIVRLVCSFVLSGPGICLLYVISLFSMYLWMNDVHLVLQSFAASSSCHFIYL